MCFDVGAKRRDDLSKICPNLNIVLDSFRNIPHLTCSNVRHSLPFIKPDTIENR